MRSLNEITQQFFFFRDKQIRENEIGAPVTCIEKHRNTRIVFV